MELYRRLYYKLFAAMADAVEALEERKPEMARDCLILAQQTAEEEILLAEEPAAPEN